MALGVGGNLANLTSKGLHTRGGTETLVKADHVTR
jgi:hypothetical protein